MLSIEGIIILAIESIILLTASADPLLITEENPGSLILISLVIIAPFAALSDKTKYKR